MKKSRRWSKARRVLIRKVCEVLVRELVSALLRRFAETVRDAAASWLDCLVRVMVEILKHLPV